MKTKTTPKWAAWALMLALVSSTLITTTGCKTLWNIFAVWTWFADLTPQEVERHYQQGLALKETQPGVAYQHLHIAALHHHPAAVAKCQQMERTIPSEQIYFLRNSAETKPLLMN